MTYRSALPHIDRLSRLRALIESLRLHQWSKNLLVFVPAVLSNRISDAGVLESTFLAFLSLGIVASATYVLNDLIDIPDDRRHRSKRHRPLASGRLLVVDGLIAVPIGLLLGFGLAMIGGTQVVLVLSCYIAVTLAYSGGLKGVPILDAFILATLFTLRLAMGIAASGAPPSPWLLVFSMFLFGSLSLAKRYTEIQGVIAAGGTEINGRGYRLSDLPLVLTTGVATGLGAVLIMVLYIIDDAFHQSFYGNTSWLWGFPCILFFFVSRIWLVCQRGELDDDPVVFAVNDPASLALAGGLAACFLLAWGGVGW